jgi:hypothetical protein
MYLGGVNRGISFTKAGFYMTGLVLVLGFFATGSGYNGLFLALGFGLSFLVISGLLSEKTIRAADLEGVADAHADAGEPFTVTFQVCNTSPSWYVFGLENLVTTEMPKFRLLQPKIEALMEARLLVLPPGQSVSIPGRCQGLRRGWYHDFFIIQRTLFPFGLISKFKVARLSANIWVLPPRDPELGLAFGHELQRRMAGQPNEHEFHSHRRLTPHAPMHALDWKKNASLPPEEWIMKTYESPATEFGICVEPDWTAIQLLNDEAEYEKALSRLRTVCEVVGQSGKPLALRGGNGRSIFGYDACLEAIVRAPQFSSRAEAGNWPMAGRSRAGWYLRLRLSPRSHTLEREPVRLAG